MNKIKTILVAFSISLFSSAAFSAPTVTVQGVYMGKNSRVAKIRNKNKKIIRVPIKSVKVPLRGLIEGIAVVQAKVSLKDMIRYNGNPVKNAKK